MQDWQHKPTQVDLFLEDKDKKQHLFELKTVKPNKDVFRQSKRNLLEWIAVILTQNNTTQLQTYIAIPYNPYEPNPYNRWTIRNTFSEEEIKVGKEFWDFLGGTGTYEKLLQDFECAGQDLKEELDEYFAKFAK